MPNLSKTQIDRLGNRLKAGTHSEQDLRLLDDYRRSFRQSYEFAVKQIRSQHLAPTGRAAKSTVSIVEKLRRESIRLSQMQDIAGCRVVVTGIEEQERVVVLLGSLFPGASVIDRRDNPSHGYRAVHIIAFIFGNPIEIQVRTYLQHQWAELSEKSSDILDPTIKYGGGPDTWRTVLTNCSQWVALYEKLEKAHSVAGAAYEDLAAAHEKSKKAAARLLEHEHLLPDHKVQEIKGNLAESAHEMERVEQVEQERRSEIEHAWKKTAEHLNKMISTLDERKRKQP